MAAMLTTLNRDYSNLGNSRVSTTDAHTLLSPELVIEKRRPADGNKTVAEYSLKCVKATEDADGLTLKDKVSMEAVVRVPIQGVSADVTSLLAIFRDIVAGDEFTNAVNTLEFV